ncbi:MAG: hypothetical protein NXI31_19940 [bacterium]|nr:hypothetical protein [bacterium]
MTEGTQSIEPAELERIEAGGAPDHSGFGGPHDRGWLPRIQVKNGKRLLGNGEVPESIRPKVWSHEKGRRLDQLRQLNGQRVWFGWRADWGLTGGIDGLHPIAQTQRELAAVSCLMRTPPRKLAAPVATPSPRVEAVRNKLSAGRMTGREVLAELQPRDAAMLPGLLHAMVRSLEQHHSGENLGEPRSLQIRGYNASATCVFDVFAFVSQDLRGFLSGCSENDGQRAAEARGLAAHLLFAACARLPHPTASQLPASRGHRLAHDQVTARRSG